MLSANLPAGQMKALFHENIKFRRDGFEPLFPVAAGVILEKGRTGIWEAE
jgi:hypothetical protein